MNAQKELRLKLEKLAKIERRELYFYHMTA